MRTSFRHLAGGLGALALGLALPSSPVHAGPGSSRARGAPPPKVTLPSAVSANTDGTTTVDAGCRAVPGAIGTCSGVLTLQAPRSTFKRIAKAAAGAPDMVTIGRSSFRIRVGHHRRLRVPLSSPARWVLRGGETIRVTAKLTRRDGAGASHRSTRRLRLQPHRHG